MVQSMTRPVFIPAADYVARMRAGAEGRHAANPAAVVSRCTQCGQWTWEGSCTLHPDATQEDY